MLFTAEQLETPLVKLEFYGLDIRVINTLEKRASIVWIRDLVGVKDVDLVRVDMMGVANVRSLKIALCRFLGVKFSGDEDEINRDNRARIRRVCREAVHAKSIQRGDL